ncbi:uncharacterized protein [Chelonus insularis]|uniref:uncharacterized protein n=1 Tax=Chelonus insularis TaxID=460826 RepID=UPI00158EC288|nr:uncharacterized protein LOC118064433 [Chelonus insularis]
MMMSVITTIFCVFLSINSISSLLIDDECYQYYSIFGIHINNIKIETCQEVDVVHLPKEEIPRFVLYVEDKNKSEIFITPVNQHDNGSLMNKSTPIFVLWNKIFNHEDSTEGNLTHVNEFAPDLANFSFYHNPSRNVALVLFYYGSFSVVEGVVGDYTLRFIERTQKYIWMKMRHPHERIPINWKSLGAPEVKNLELSDYNLNSHINAVNISTVVFLDNLSIQEKLPTELVKSVLIYFNAVNMLYANFTSPRIQLVIKALMVPITVYGKTYDVLQPQKLFENHNDSWLEPIVIFNMMITPVCKHSNSKICIAHGKIHNNRLYCDEKDISKKSPSIYHIRHMDLQHGYSKAAQMLALSLNASLLDYTDECSGIMNAYQDPPDLPLFWSNCTINKLSNYFRSVNDTCFRETALL